MDKQKVGRFIKSLRKEQGLTQEGLVEKFSAFVGVECAISGVTVSKWERGESLPDIQNMIDLAKFFSITVDELFNGERQENVNFEKDYPEYTHNGKISFKEREEQYIQVSLRFRELLEHLIENTATPNEENEFSFLCNKFYNLSECALTTTSPGMNDAISIVKFRIMNLSIRMPYSTFEEKLWEAYKLFESRGKIAFETQLYLIAIGKQHIGHSSLELQPLWENDILLALIQYFDVTHPLGESNNLKLFEDTFGCEYDSQTATKKAIKLLIENGACLNYHLLKNNKPYTQPRKRQLLIPVDEGGKCRYFSVRDTPKNRRLLRTDINGNTPHYRDYGHFVRAYMKNPSFAAGMEYNIYKDAVDRKDAQLHNIVYSLYMKEYMQKRDEERTKKLLAELDSLTLDEIRDKYFTKETAV